VAVVVAVIALAVWAVGLIVIVGATVGVGGHILVVLVVGNAVWGIVLAASAIVAVVAGVVQEEGVLKGWLRLDVVVKVVGVGPHRWPLWASAPA
jgi:hypothetical protein